MCVCACEDKLVCASVCAHGRVCVPSARAHGRDRHAHTHTLNHPRLICDGTDVGRMDYDRQAMKRSCYALAVRFEDGIVALEGVSEHGDVFFVACTWHTHTQPHREGERAREREREKKRARERERVCVCV